MGYRDDFYKVENIIGITGPIDSLPSVYFQDTKTGEFGHITQVHKSDYNQGRCGVRASPDWRISNKCGGTCTCGKSQAHEFIGTKKFHVSRSLFVPLTKGKDDEAIAIAAQAIWWCPDMKTDPRTKEGRIEQQTAYNEAWAEAHQTGPRGRRNAIDYSGQGLANKLLKIAYPDRVK